MNISILGTGSWGTANAVLLANARHNVTVWGRSADAVEEIRRTRMNAKYLPGETLPESIVWTADRATALKNANIVVVAVPSRHFEEVCRSFSPYFPPEATVVSLTKGVLSEDASSDDGAGGGRIWHEAGGGTFGSLACGGGREGDADGGDGGVGGPVRRAARADGLDGAELPRLHE